MGEHGHAAVPPAAPAEVRRGGIRAGGRPFWPHGGKGMAKERSAHRAAARSHGASAPPPGSWRWSRTTR